MGEKLTAPECRMALLGDMGHVTLPVTYARLRIRGHHPSTIRATEERLLISLVVGRGGKRLYDLTEAGRNALAAKAEPAKVTGLLRDFLGDPHDESDARSAAHAYLNRPDTKP